MTDETRLIDYSFSRPKPADIAAAGYVGVMRYLSGVRGKDLTKTEAKALHARGLAIGLVFETTANRSTAGYRAGADDAKKAAAQAEALGYPVGCPIYFAVDFDANPAQVQTYFDGVIHTLAGHPAGIYGGIRVIDGVTGPAYRWQTAAWSSGKLSKRADLYQRVGHEAKAIPGGGYDENVICRPNVMWAETGPVILRPAGKRTPKPHKHPKTPKPLKFGPIRTRVFGRITAQLDAGHRPDAHAVKVAEALAVAWQKATK